MTKLAFVNYEGFPAVAYLSESGELDIRLGFNKFGDFLEFLLAGIQFYNMLKRMGLIYNARDEILKECQADIPDVFKRAFEDNNGKTEANNRG